MRRNEVEVILSPGYPRSWLGHVTGATRTLLMKRNEVEVILSPDCPHSCLGHVTGATKTLFMKRNEVEVILSPGYPHPCLGHVTGAMGTMFMRRSGVEASMIPGHPKRDIWNPLKFTTMIINTCITEPSQAPQALNTVLENQNKTFRTDQVFSQQCYGAPLLDSASFRLPRLTQHPLRQHTPRERLRAPLKMVD